MATQQKKGAATYTAAKLTRDKKAEPTTTTANETGADRDVGAGAVEEPIALHPTKAQLGGARSREEKTAEMVGDAAEPREPVVREYIAPDDHDSYAAITGATPPNGGESELRAFPVGELVFVNCPLPGYEGLRVGYRLNNRFHVAQQYLNMPADAPLVAHYRIMAQFVRRIEGWNFGRPRMEKKRVNQWVTHTEPKLDDEGQPVLDPETGEAVWLQNERIEEVEIEQVALDAEGQIALEPVPCPDPAHPDTFAAWLDYDIDLWHWVRLDGYGKAQEQLLKN